MPYGVNEHLDRERRERERAARDAAGMVRGACGHLHHPGGGCITGPACTAPARSPLRKDPEAPLARSARILFPEIPGGDLPRFGKPAGVAEYLISYLLTETDVLQDPREHTYVLALSAKHRLLTPPYLLSIGGDSQAIIEMRPLYRFALLTGAHSIILAHTHPSGDPTPSTEDLRVTALARAAAVVVDIALLDHLIIGGCHRPDEAPRYHSMQEAGTL